MIEKNKRMNLVGEFIRQKRESLRISQKALGQLFTPPVTTQFISNIERGVTPLPPVHIASLARALCISESELTMLLEKEYIFKLNNRIGNNKVFPNYSEVVNPSLTVDQADYELMKTLYSAYRIADFKSKEDFFAVCESILKLPKELISSLTNK